MMYLQLGQYALASLELFGVAHNQIDTYSEVTWSSSDPATLSCANSIANPGYADLRGLKVGVVQLHVGASYDTGKGIAPWSASAEIEIIDRKVAYSEIKLLYGEVMPIGDYPVQKSKPK